jgi:hypothetical protein
VQIAGKRTTWDKEATMKCIEAVKGKDMEILKGSQNFKVPISTLREC